MPIVNVEYLVLNRVREIFIEQDEAIDLGEFPKRDKCMTKSDFVAIWNALMKIRFTEHDITDVCLTDDRFL